MSQETILFVALAMVAAVVISLFLYYKTSASRSLAWWLGTLRALSIFGVLLLIINPEFTSTTYTDLKPNLAILVDDSASMSAHSEDVSDVLAATESLEDRYNVTRYRFGGEVQVLDSLRFRESETRIEKALDNLKAVDRGTDTRYLLLSDGIQTGGADYRYAGSRLGSTVHSVVLGDTTRYRDLAIRQVNVNRYSYLDNEFPVEILINFTGSGSANEPVVIKQGNRTLYTGTVALSNAQRSATVEALLRSTAVGLQTYTVSVGTLDNERNTRNNSQSFTVEVIDEQSAVALVSSFTHPDVGTIKKSIESNRQRRVDILKPSQNINWSDYQLAIFYQPTSAASKAIQRVEAAGVNSFTITGPDAVASAYNNAQPIIKLPTSSSTDEVQPVSNPDFSAFDLARFDFSDYPPLSSVFGDIETNASADVVFFKQIGQVKTDKPLLALTDDGSRKRGVLNGSGLWRWRAESYLRDKDFSNFDEFINAVVQYMSSTQVRERLSLDYRNFYYSNEPIVLYSRYLDENYQFNPNAIVTLTAVNKNTNKSQQIPMLQRNNAYEADLSGELRPGNYAITVRVEGENLSTSGNLRIVKRDLETLLTTADADGMARLSESTGGWSIVNPTGEEINAQLAQLQDPITRTEKSEVVPLIDWRLILFVIAGLLAIEWFTRKYNGLI